MNIAFDIDRTIYDTDACYRRAFKTATDEHPFYGLERLGHAEELLIEDRTWFNPEFLMPNAIEQLKKLSNIASLYVCTARNSPIFRYGELLADTGLVVKDVLQCSNKAVECLNNNIDFIIDDDIINLRNHLQYIDVNPYYHTKFILYAGPGSSAYCYKQGIINPLTAKNTYVMTDWSEVHDIIHMEVTCNSL